MVLIHESAEQINSFKVEYQCLVECSYMSMRRHDGFEESEKALRIFVGDAGHGALSLIKVSFLGCQWRKNVSKRRMGSMCRISRYHYNDAFSLDPLLARVLDGVLHHMFLHLMLRGCRTWVSIYPWLEHPFR